MKGGDIKLFADIITERLEISCAALSGANIANEVARDRFSETTIGVRKKEDGEMWQKLFSKLIYAACSLVCIAYKYQRPQSSECQLLMMCVLLLQALLADNV